MKKLAVMINGLSAPIKDSYFLIGKLERLGYEVIRIEPILSEGLAKVVVEPSLIFGWSMGGFLAPDLALKYPRAKLILVGTGVRVNPSEATARALFEMIGKEWGLKLLGASLDLPDAMLLKGYEQLNRIPDPEVQEKYRQQMEENINLFRKLPEDQLKYLIEFLRGVDNENKLKKIKNKTLVFCGKRDKLMPINEGQKIANLIENSMLVLTDGGHYNVIGEKELPIIEKFLK